MSALRLKKLRWPEKFQGLGLGNDSRLVVSFDDGASWLELDVAKDVSVRNATDTLDSDSRKRGLFKSKLPGKKELEIEAQCLFDANDQALKNFERCSISGGIYQIGAFTEIGNGFVFYATLSDFTRQEPIDGIVTVSTKHSCVEFIDLWRTTFSASKTRRFSTYHPINLLPYTQLTSVVVLQNDED